MNIVKQPYNFFNFVETTGQAITSNANVLEFEDVLPVCEDNDVKFQVVIESADPLIHAYMLSRPVTDFILGITTFINPATNTDISTNSPVSWPQFNFERYAYSNGTSYGIVLYWKHGLPGLQQLLVAGKCYHLYIAILNGASNQLDDYIYAKRPIRLVDSKYTSVIEYKDMQNSFGFQYLEENMTNKLRLYTHLHKPQYPTDLEVYTNSKGNRVMSKAITKTVYQGLVKSATKELHQCINQALLHDYVSITGNGYNVTGGIEGVYSLDWPEVPSSNKTNASYNFNVNNFSGVNENNGILPTPGNLLVDQLQANSVLFYVYSNFVDYGLLVKAELYSNNQTLISTYNCVLNGGAWGINFGGLTSGTNYTLRVWSEYNGSNYKSKIFTYNFTTP